MARKTQPPDKVDKVLSYQEMKDAIRKIDRRIKDLDDFDVSAINERWDPKIEILSAKLDALLTEIFGSNSTQYGRYGSIRHLDTAGLNLVYETSIREVREGLVQGISRAKGTLEAIKTDFLEKLEDAGESETGKPLRAYEGLDLHPEINRQVGKLYRDGHYSEAVEKSVKVLNNLVRMRSGEELDGTALMERVFSPKNPILQFNKLSDESDKNEQKGFMYLFSGAVTGLRNPRAHRLMEDDAERALEFIAFISLLAKLVDETRGP